MQSRHGSLPHIETSSNDVIQQRTVFKYDPTGVGMLGGDVRNRIIDGWRGISVTLVIISHLADYRLDLTGSILPIHAVIQNPLLLIQNLTFRLISPLGGVGVSFFFVISGFLITTLLINEQIRDKSVSISAFYIRRALRIFPAFLLYITIVLILKIYGLILVNNDAFIRSGLFICNISEFRCSWWLAHTWSLSVEEQFYLCWPLTFLILRDRKAFGISGILAALFLGALFINELGPFVYIALGALVAVSARARAWITAYSTTPIILIAAAVVVLEPLTFPVPGLEKAILAIRPVLIAIIFFGTLLTQRGGPILALVSNRFVATIGLFSYSLYLWQQLSLAPVEWNGQLTGADVLYRYASTGQMFAFIPIAIASYYLAERPCMRIGRSLSKRLSKLPAHSQQAEQPMLDPNSESTSR